MNKAVKFNNDEMKSLRKSLGLSLQDVASAIGSSRSYAWTIEQGRSEPTGRAIFLLSAVLGVTMDRFYASNNDQNMSRVGKLSAIILKAIADFEKQEAKKGQ